MADTKVVQFCPECEGISFTKSALAGFVACRTCGKLIKGEIGTRAGSILSKSGEDEPEYDFELEVPEDKDVYIGWRAWNLGMNDMVPRLGSVSHQTRWEPRQPVEAACGRTKANGKHKPPHESCTCGLYSAKTREHLLSMSYHFYDLEAGLLTVIGTVSLWGKVIEGTQGWRAQFGYPRELFLPFEAYGHAEPLREEYGVKVTLANTLASIND